MKFTFEEAKEIALKALAPLGEDYRALIREGFENRWIDVYENAGKRSGAYSAGARVHPYRAAQLHGHARQPSSRSRTRWATRCTPTCPTTRQPTVYQDYVIFVAEVASTCNEALLMQHLLIGHDRQKGARLPHQPLPRAVPHARSTGRPCSPSSSCDIGGAERARAQTLTADLLCARVSEAERGSITGRTWCSTTSIALEWAQHPALLLQLLCIPVRNRLRRCHRAVAAASLREGEPAVARLPRLPVRRLQQDPDRPAARRRRRHDHARSRSRTRPPCSTA